MERILLIDDDTELCELLSEYLGSEGFSVDAVHDGETGVRQALSKQHHLVLLDVMLPKLNGFEVLKAIRAQSNIPILMLTARGEDVDRILGLEFGADDYLAKPFNQRELVARIKAILRRLNAPVQPARSGEEVLQVGDVSLNTNNLEVYVGDQLIQMTGTEFTILQNLLEAAGSVVTREALTERALGRKLEPYDRSIDVHVSHVRKKLGADAEGKPRIKTIRGAGYLYAK